MFPTNNTIINAEFEKYKVPLIRIGPNEIKDNNATISIEDYMAAKDAVNHLISHGHKRIAFVKGVEDQDATYERLKGYKAALIEAGINVDESLIFSGDFNFASGMSAGDKILDMPTPVTAVFAANDDMAAGVLVSALKRNIKVPDDLSVMGFDDTEIAEKIWPQLTTVRQPLAEFGQRAVEILIELAGKNNDQHRCENKIERLNYEIIIRNSTAKISSS